MIMQPNVVVGFPDGHKHFSANSHLKRIPTTVREIPDVGLVYTSPRKKDDRIAIVKSVAKALKNGGKINMKDDVQDVIGMKFVLLEPSVQPVQLADRVVSVLASAFNHRLMKIENDDCAGLDHGQSADIKFTRRQVWLADMPVPIELMFYDLENYLNSLLDVGIKDSEGGLYNGRAHRLLELRRALQAAPVFFPTEVYPLDLRRYFIDRSASIAQDLVQRYQVS